MTTFVPDSTQNGARPFLTDVATVATSIEDTLRGLRLYRGDFPNLETVLQERISPDALKNNLLTYREFITLCGEYLRLIPNDVSIGLTDKKKAEVRKAAQALTDQFGNHNMYREARLHPIYQDQTRSAIDEDVHLLEGGLQDLLVSHTRIIARRYSNGKTPTIDLAADAALLINNLRTQLYTQLGIRVHEDPKLITELSFRALATKRGWLRKTSQGQYQLAKNGQELVTELHDAQLTPQQFEQYTGARITLPQPTMPAVTKPQITSDIPPLNQKSQPNQTRYQTVFVNARTWAEGKDTLHKKCAVVPNPHPTYTLENRTVLFRPLTIQESAEDCITNLERPGHGLWINQKDSCTAIIYGPNGLFKIQLISPQLLELPKEYNQSTFQVDYNAIQGNDIIELNRNDAKYNTGLTFDEEQDHPFWMTVIPDNHIRRRFSELQRAKKHAGYTARGVYLRTNARIGEGMAVCIDSHYGGSNAYCNNNLNNNVSFANRVAK